MMILRYNRNTMTLTTSRTTTQDLTTSSGQQKSKMNMDYHIQPQSFNQSRLDQSRSCEMEHTARPVTNERNRSHTSASLTPRVKPPGRKIGS